MIRTSLCIAVLLLVGAACHRPSDRALFPKTAVRDAPPSEDRKEQFELIADAPLWGVTIPADTVVRLDRYHHIESLALGGPVVIDGVEIPAGSVLDVESFHRSGLATVVGTHRPRLSIGGNEIWRIVLGADATYGGMAFVVGDRVTLSPSGTPNGVILGSDRKVGGTRYGAGDWLELQDGAVVNTTSADELAETAARNARVAEEQRVARDRNSSCRASCTTLGDSNAMASCTNRCEADYPR